MRVRVLNVTRFKRNAPRIPAAVLTITLEALTTRTPACYDGYDEKTKITQCYTIFHGTRPLLSGNGVDRAALKKNRNAKTK